MISKINLLIVVVFTNVIFWGTLSCSHKSSYLEMKQTADQDPYLYLEEVASQRALDWVEPHSLKAVEELTRSKHFREMRSIIAQNRLAKDKLASPILAGNYVYNFWTDAKYPKGLVRRTSVASYNSGKPTWENILDVGALAKEEKVNWVYKGSLCLEPEHRYCLVSLSDGGTDATTVREFDLKEKVFRKDGFALPSAKHYFAWWSENEVLLASDFGPGTLTVSGYPRQIRRWKRGTKFDSGDVIFEGRESDMGVSPMVSIREGKTVGLLTRRPTFFEQVSALWVEKEGEFKKQELPIPLDADIEGTTGDQILVRFRSDWKTDKQTYVRGSLASFPIVLDSKDKWIQSGQILFQPDNNSALASVATSKNFVFITVLKDVKSQFWIAQQKEGAWNLTLSDLPTQGAISVLAAEDTTDTLYVQYDDFLTPSTIFSGEPKQAKFAWAKRYQLPSRFNSEGMVSEQLFADSKDGTKIPYFVVRKEKIHKDGTNPTLLYGYGGFEISLTPRYIAEPGKAWIEKGGIYVIANIRGGGEYGPRWHEAALKENRQRAYDDFIAVAEDLIRLKYTSPKKLGIRGGSNGGLLVGAVTMQRPELFNAVICQIPLLDMVRYRKLPPGDSWNGEYGDASDPVVGPVIWSYSPYQNIRADRIYPKMFFWSSLKDDRVHPGHARKMVARMEEQGHKVLYYESKAGGHGGAGDIEQAITDEAMALSYLHGQLTDK